MDLAWTPLAVLGFTAAVLDLALAALLMSVRPDATVNRRLSAVLVFSGLTGVAFTSRLLLLDREDAFGMTCVFMTLVALSIVAIGRFVATIPSPLAAPLRGRLATGGLLVASVAIILLLLARPTLFVPSMRPFVHVPGWEFENGPAWAAIGVALSAMSIFALIVAVDAWRRAPQGIQGRRAGTFALAFGVSNGVQALSTLYLVAVGDLDSSFPTLVNFAAPPLATLFFSLLVAYGILRFQLFDIDVRIKRGIRRGALAGLFVAVFFAATELAQIVFQERIGAYVGVLATAALAFVLHPLQRLADRVADAAMPAVQATPQYLAYRRLEIYREAYEGLVADGALTPKERATLERLRATLGLAPDDCAALERQVAGDEGAVPV